MRQLAVPPAVPVSTRIGVIGCGRRISDVIAHLQKAAPDVRVTAVHDPDPAAAEYCRGRVGPEAVVCGGEAELCARADVDWVFIGSWNSLHARHAVAAFNAGKHVFCEKPLALDLDQAAAMHAAWRASGRTFALGLVLRYSPIHRAARAALDAGRIGRLLSFEFNETLPFNHGGYIHGNWRRRTRDAGTHLLEKCCHDLDLALWMTDDLPSRVASFGGCTFFTPENKFHQDRIGRGPKGEVAFEAWDDPHRVNPFTGDKDIVDHQVAILEFGGGVRAMFHTHCMAAMPERRFYMIGSEGALKLDAYTGKLELRRVGWNEPIDVSEPAAGVCSGHGGSDQMMVRELAECMAGLRAPAAGFDEGLRSLVVAQAVDQAMNEGRVIDLAPLLARARGLGLH